MSSFLQSENWLKNFEKVYDFGRDFSFIQRKIPLLKFKYWYGSHVSVVHINGAHIKYNSTTSPTIDSDFGSDSKEPTKVLIEKAKQSGVVFVRFSPYDLKTLETFQKTKFKIRKVKDVEPAVSLILDLQKSEDELLKQMKSKTRYNIRLAEKHGVQIQILENISEEVFEKVWKLFEQTAQRKKIRNHPKKYYKNKKGVWVLAWKEENLLVANFCVTYEDTFTYLFGASSDENKKLMAPYLAQWQSIKWAKQKGFKKYDFWGVEERYPGVARFKKGFAGEVVEYLGTFELILHPIKYKLYRIIKKLKQLSR